MSESTSNLVIEALKQVENEIPQLILKYEQPNTHGNQTLKCLDAMRKERQLCDVILTVEGHELFAHRALLSCHSNYFFELFLENENETTANKPLYYRMDGVEYQALKLILQFIYRGSFCLTSDLIRKIYLASYQLRIETVFKACSNYLGQELTSQNCLSVRHLAMDDELRMNATDFIQTNFLDLLERREFLTLPTIKLELIDLTSLKPKTMCDLIINWIAQQLSNDDSNLQELCEYMHLLYLNGESFQDCADMNDQNHHFSDIIKDYQSYKLTKRNLSTTSSSSTQNENAIFEVTDLQISNDDLILPTPTNISTHAPETKLIHVNQSNEHNYIALAIVNGKMLVISIHLSSSSNPHTPEHSILSPAEKTPEDNHTTPILAGEKDVPLGSLLTARCCFGVTTINDKIYVIGGYNRGDCLDTVEVYDPNENKWKCFPYLMTSRRGRVAVTSLDNQIYACGGSDGQRELNTGEYIDLSTMTKWSTIKKLVTPIVHSAMCSDGNYVYLIGGMEGDRCRNDCYRFNPKDNTWSNLPPMKSERSQAGIVYVDKKIYAFGGSTLNRCLSSCEVLSLTTNEWISCPAMKECRRGCGAVAYQDQILIIGGSNGVSVLTSIEIFNPQTNEWLMNINSNQISLNIARIGLGVTVCQDKIYVIGGFDGRTFLKSVEVYDESTQKFRLNYQNTIKQTEIDEQSS